MLRCESARGRSAMVSGDHSRRLEIPAKMHRYGHSYGDDNKKPLEILGESAADASRGVGGRVGPVSDGPVRRRPVNCLVPSPPPLPALPNIPDDLLTSTRYFRL